MTTYYDHRAERTMAEAEADARRAQAEALRVETTLRLERERRQMETDRVQQERRAREERARSRTAQRENRRRQREQTRAARRAAIRRGAGALRTATVQRVPFLVGGVAMGSPIAIAWNGQLEFAREVMHLGALSPALPISLEGAVWYLAYLTHRAITLNLPTIRYRVATWALAAVAATMNFWHGSTPKGLPANAPQQIIEQATRDAQQTGVALALASLLGIGLWELTVGLTQHTASRRSLTEIRRAAWRRLRYPRLSWQAASIRAARGADCTVEDAWAAAWVDRYGVGPDAPRRDRRLGRKVTRYQSKADRKAAKDGRLSIVGGQIVGRPSADAAPADPEGEKAIEQMRGWDPAAAARRASRRASLAVLTTGPCVTPAVTQTRVNENVTSEVTASITNPPASDLLPALPELTPVTPMMTPTVTPGEVNSTVINDSDEATKTEVMRAFWDSERAQGRYPRPIDLARHANADRGLASRLRRAWVEELHGWEKRRARIGRDRGTNGNDTPLADDIPMTTTEVS